MPYPVRLFVTGIVALLLTPAAAAEFDWLRQQLQRLDENAAKPWAYTVILSNAEDIAVVRRQMDEGGDIVYDVLTVNGDTPSDGERRRYREQINRSNNNRFLWQEAVEPGSMRLQGDGSVTFQPVGKDTDTNQNGAEMMAGMRGVMTFNGQRRIRQIRIYLPEPRGFGIARINAFENNVHITDVGDHLMIERVETHIRGRLALIKKIEVDSTVAFSDFDLATTQSAE